MKRVFFGILMIGSIGLFAQTTNPSSSGTGTGTGPGTGGNPGTSVGTPNPAGNNQLNPSGQQGVVQPNANINSSFSRDYNGASNANWQRTGDNYSVDYMYNGSQYNSTYSNNGTRLGTSTTADPNKMPAAVTRSLQNGEYSKWKTGNTYQLTTPDNKTYYQYELRNGEKTRTIYYDSNGVMLKKRPF
jgi:hypothetical protein